MPRPRGEVDRALLVERDHLVLVPAVEALVDHAGVRLPRAAQAALDEMPFRKLLLELQQLARGESHDLHGGLRAAF